MYVRCLLYKSEVSFVAELQTIKGTKQPADITLFSSSITIQ